MQADLAKAGAGLIGRKFVGHGRARAFGGVAQPLLLAEAIDLDDHPVDFVGEFGAGGGVLVIEGEHVRERGAALVLGDQQAPGAECCKAFAVARLAVSFRVYPVGEKAQVALGY